MLPDSLPPYEQELRAFLAPLGVDLDAQAVVFQLYRTSTDVIATLEAKALRPLGLSHTGFALLVTIWVGGPQEVRGLARKHRLSKPSITSAIGTLERAGLVTRERSGGSRSTASGSRRPSSARPSSSPSASTTPTTWPSRGPSGRRSPPSSTSSRRASRGRTTRSTGRASRRSSTTRASWAS